MLGLNKHKTLYKIKCYYYEYVGNDGNKQNWKPTPKTFYGNYASTRTIERLTNTQGLPANHITLETNSSIKFKQNDKIIINGEAVLVKQEILDINPLTAQYTNIPTIYTKILLLE